MPVDPIAAQGFNGALSYERGRPGYAPAAVARVVAELGLGPSSRVLDLAAGTGKLSRQIAPHVGSLVAVEPSAPMRAVLAEQVPGAEVVDGEAERLPLPDASVDAVVVGEAFHWFATEAAVEEMARVLRPGGGVAVLWNIPVGADPPRPESLAALVAHHRQVVIPGQRANENGAWREPFAAVDAFGPLEAASAEHEHVLDREGYVAQIASWSFIAALPDADRAEVLDRAAEVAPERFTTTFRTEAHWTRRR